MTTKSMLQIVADLAPLSRAVCSIGYDEAVRYLLNQLPFHVITVPDTCKHNGWVIPPSWDVVEARIIREGRTIYDGTTHPMGVISLSAAFSGRVTKEELRKHLFYDHRNEMAIPFHYRQQFRSWCRDWGFCVPKRFFDALEPGEYDVVIQTAESSGTLKILEYRHRGTLECTFVLGGNLDHAGAANDGISGCVVGLEVMRRLHGRRTKFSYALVLSPGIIGSELYLAMRTEEERNRIIEGVFLEMLGSPTPLALQESRQSMVSISQALHAGLEESGRPYHTGDFETIMVNDEYIWENYGIPMLSFSRFPYPEYHSSMDDIGIIVERSLTEAVDVLMSAIDRLESLPMVVKQFQGNVCLSNPQYDLYVDYGQVALGDTMCEERRRMRRLMDLIPALEHPISVQAIANHVGLPDGNVLAYLQRWADKGLIKLI